MERFFDVKIIIAAHKPYRMPSDEMYLPLRVGAALAQDPLPDGMARDNTGENISAQNASFCELTGLYWAWKNLCADYIGLVHYRRHFRGRRAHDRFDRILTFADLEPYLGKAKAFVPKRRHYRIETLYSHYAHTHSAEQLDETKRIISERCPEYLESCERVFHQRSGHMFNMMILERELLDSYCAWLFDILFALRDRLPEENLSTFQARFYGRISEILFNVWLDHQVRSVALKSSEIRELPVVYLERVPRFKKGAAFLRAKLFGRKYESSF